jgi:hypothetical protein
MVATLQLQVEVVGCPTVCRHCWAQGVPYPAMPLADVAWVLEQTHRFGDTHGLAFGAYPGWPSRPRSSTATEALLGCWSRRLGRWPAGRGWTT